MTGPRIIQKEQVREVFPDFPLHLDEFLAASNPLYAGYYHNTPACVAGFIPQQTSGVALLWGWTTPITLAHPLHHARWARRLIAQAHHVYPTIIGYCTPPTMSWLAFLGANFGPMSNGSCQFTLEVPHAHVPR